MKQHKFSEPGFIAELQRLLAANDFDAFFEKVYEVITEDVAFTAKEIRTNKERGPFMLAQVKRMLKRCIAREEYEKCTPLNEILLQACITTGQIQE